MLEDNQSPIMRALTFADPCEGTFVLSKLPAGLMRVSKAKSADGDASGSVASHSTSAAAAVTADSVATINGESSRPGDRRLSNDNTLISMSSRYWEGGQKTCLHYCAAVRH
jgi:hypothetical protein